MKIFIPLSVFAVVIAILLVSVYLTKYKRAPINDLPVTSGLEPYSTPALTIMA